MQFAEAASAAHIWIGPREEQAVEDTEENASFSITWGQTGHQ